VVADQIGCVSTKTITIAQPAAVIPTLTPTHLSCYNGTNGAASISLAGGTSPFTYTWSPGSSNNQTISNLTAGTYTCNVKDGNGCPYTYTIAITQPSQINPIPSSTSVTCSGAANGTAAVLVTGGTSPYTYSWSPTGGTSATAVNLPGGVYNVTIHDNNGCPRVVTLTVTEASPIVLSCTTTNIKCYGTHTGSVTVNATGGTGNPSFTWTPSGGSNSSATGLNPGTYTCTVQDQNGCTTFTTATITQPAQMSVTTTYHGPTCSGATNGYASVNANGGVAPYTYSWNTNPVQTSANPTNMPSGTYTVVVTDQNGCPKKKTVTIPSPEPKDSLTVTGVLCSTDPVVLLNAPAGGVAPDSIKGPYQWYDTGTGITGQTGSSYSANQSNINNYSVTWWYKGCRYKTKDIVETVYQDLFSMPSTNVFTPNADKINDEFIPFSFANSGGTYNASLLQSLASTYELWVYDRWGKLMFHTTDITQLWDGKTEGGKDAPDGTYYWIAKYKTHCNGARGDKESKGFVQLIR
jgi:gliding motility-associated-like protein